MDCDTREQPHTNLERGTRSSYCARVPEGQTTPELEQLTPPPRILGIAVAAARTEEFAEYADFQEDMLLEILANRKPNEVGYRLFEIETVLKAHSWKKEGRSAHFYPPPGALLQR